MSDRADAPTALLPRLTVGDPVGAHWLRQVTLRLRREVCWTWLERGLLTGSSLAPLPGVLPPFAEPALAALDLARYDDDKQRFFESDETAAYLSQLIAMPEPDDDRGAGGFGWVARELALAPVECFVLALALLASIDGAAGPVFAACLNDPQRSAPTRALAQRLWDSPQEVLAAAGCVERLHRVGLLAAAAPSWDAPLAVAGPVAHQLLFPGAPVAALLTALPEPTDGLDARELELVVARLRTSMGEHAELLPLVGVAGAPFAATAARVARACDQPGVQPAPETGRADVAVLATIAWLRGALLYVPFELLARAGNHDAAIVALPTVPLTIAVGIEDPGDVNRLPAGCTLAPVTLGAGSYAQRLAAWRRALPLTEGDPPLARAVAECSRRFRLQTPLIERHGRTLAALGRAPTPQDVFAVCRANIDLGALAQPVVPRFERADLMLPSRQARQIDELIHAAEQLTTVHHDWGTARAWNESGISTLFAGASGTGKTMAAEVIASAVGLPLFRIDLSQVVNKYIGETEKNLRRLFDVADSTEVLLFFDEADALFGKRTEVKDAHDRYANLEISYLLERMERFRGVAILATNRKRDLDEAFLRRLRFLVDFPLPGVEERLRIWQMAIPPNVDRDTLDLRFLAQRFTLTGGHIRSIVFQACLQSARDGAVPCLEMRAVLAAVRRELDKLNRPISIEQFGDYAQLAED